MRNACTRFAQSRRQICPQEGPTWEQSRGSFAQPDPATAVRRKPHSVFLWLVREEKTLLVSKHRHPLMPWLLFWKGTLPDFSWKVQITTFHNKATTHFWSAAIFSAYLSKNGFFWSSSTFSLLKMFEVVNILFCCWETIGLLLPSPQAEIGDNLQNFCVLNLLFLSNAETSPELSW